jgi:hypothetical protein
MRTKENPRNSMGHREKPYVENLFKNVKNKK